MSDPNSDFVAVSPGTFWAFMDTHPHEIRPYGGASLYVDGRTPNGSIVSRVFGYIASKGLEHYFMDPSFVPEHADV